MTVVPKPRAHGLGELVALLSEKLKYLWRELIEMYENKLR